MLQYSQENFCLLLIDLRASRPATFSFEYYKIFKNTYFDENLRTMLIFLLKCLFLLLIQ